MMMETILVVDDEQRVRQSLKGALEEEGFRVITAPGGEEAIALVRDDMPDVVLLDVWMQGMDGIETLKELKELYPALEIIIISGHSNIEIAVRGIKLGAFNFLEKPLSIDQLVLMIRNALEHRKLASENIELREKIETRYEIIGNSPALNRVLESVQKAAPTNGRVLITGESGTGKELIARAIHRNSRRARGPFIEVNCAAIPEELIESELFGHEKGSFTGAAFRKKGKFELADTGTLFLDEIGDMSLKVQAKVLRVLEQQKVERIGGQNSIQVDVRVIAASNKDLAKEIEAGNFREDLYYRLNVIPVQLPPLRERREDIPLLIQYFANLIAQESGRRVKRFREDAINVLSSLPWPGNVRELRNIVERVIILASRSAIGAEDIRTCLGAQSFRAPEPESQSVTLKEARDRFERDFIIQQLQAHDGNVSRTAEALGIERSNLHRKIRALGLAAPDSSRSVS